MAELPPDHSKESSTGDLLHHKAPQGTKTINTAAHFIIWSSKEGMWHTLFSLGWAFQ